MDITAIAQHLINKLDAEGHHLEAQKEGIVMLFEAIRDASIEEQTAAPRDSDSDDTAS